MNRDGSTGAPTMAAMMKAKSDQNGLSNHLGIRNKYILKANT